MAATTKSGLRYPGSTAAANVPQDIQNLATDLDSLAGKYATTAARDAANPAPAQGDLARVAGVLQIYNSGWISVGVSASRAAVSATTANGVPNVTWQQVNWGSGEGTVVGPDLTTTVSGLTVFTTGWYAVTAIMTWTANATGLRGISVGAAVAGNYQKIENPVTPYNTTQDFTVEMQFNAGDTITLGSWQSSGAVLNLTGYRHLTARRVG